MLSYNPQTGLNHHRETVTAGATSDPLFLDGSGGQASVAAHPAGNMTIEFSLSPKAEIEAAAGDWLPWGPGLVASAASTTLDGPVTALRATAGGSDGVWEVVVAP